MDQIDLTRLIGALPPKWQCAVRNVYLIGSRAWADRSLQDGSMDWDFFMVIDGYFGPEHGIELTDPALRECVDISAYSCERWAELIAQHELLCLMCLYLPRHLVWREEFVISRFCICLKKLVRGVMKEKTKTFDMAHRAFAVERNFYLGRKNIIHCFRYLNFGHQLVQNNPTLDISCAKQFYAEVINSDDEDWKSVEAKYKPRIDLLATQLKTEVERLVLAEVASCNAILPPTGNPFEMVEQHIHSFASVQLAIDYLVRNFACDVKYFSLPCGAKICRIRSSADSPTVTQCPLMAGYHGLFWNSTTNEILCARGITPVVYDEANPVGSASAAAPLLSHAWGYATVPVGDQYCCAWYRDQWWAFPCGDSNSIPLRSLWPDCDESSLDPLLSYTILSREGAKPQVLLVLNLKQAQLVRSFAGSRYISEVSELACTDDMITRFKRLLCRYAPLQTECLLVLCDKLGLVEFPSPARVALTDILSETKPLISVARLLPLVRATWPNSAISMIPLQLRATFSQIEEKYSKFVALISSMWAELQAFVTSESDFAAAVTSRGSKYKPYSSILFRFRAVFMDSTPHHCDVAEELGLTPLASVLAAMDRTKS